MSHLDFFFQHLVNGISWGAIYALIAVGYTMVYGVLRFINFAHGDVYMLGAFIGLFVARATGLSASTRSPALLLLLFLVPMVTCAVMGAIIERLAYRPLRNASRLSSLITAIGVSLFLEYGGQMKFGANPQYYPIVFDVSSAAATDQTTRLHITDQQVLVLVVSLFLMVLLNYIIFRTKVGKAVRAVSQDFEAASLVGIPTDFVISCTFALGSAMAAAAAVLVSLSPDYRVIDPLMGIMPGIKAFVAAVVGGIGNVTGAVVGGLLMGIAENLVAGPLGLSGYRDAVAFAALILILLFKPDGLFGKGKVEKV